MLFDFSKELRRHRSGGAQIDTELDPGRRLLVHAKGVGLTQALTSLRDTVPNRAGQIVPPQASFATVGVRQHHIEVFAVADGRLRHRWHRHGAWSQWTPMELPKGIRAAHVGAGAHSDWMDLFVVTENGRLLQRWWGVTEHWSEWSDWGDGFAGTPMVASVADNHAEVFVIRHGKLVHKWLVNGQWSDWAEF